ncbi:hypothetical protein ACERII_05915 [Evansella sp. AB-rgal1]|uniref:hypothetical protein n=1 Tax=Evansella sp. AB-rgal1 TaxID=3242696 RepID=UPI00359DE885
MIDLNFEKYSEITLTNLYIKEAFPVQHWVHCIVGFSSEEMPEDIVDPEILVILNEDKEALQIILYEEGCDSPNYQLTDSEKTQVKQWISEANDIM